MKMRRFRVGDEGEIKTGGKMICNVFNSRLGNVEKGIKN